jgi:hypothetical protein
MKCRPDEIRLHLIWANFVWDSIENLILDNLLDKSQLLSWIELNRFVWDTANLFHPHRLLLFSSKGAVFNITRPLVDFGCGARVSTAGIESIDYYISSKSCTPDIIYYIHHVFICLCNQGYVHCWKTAGWPWPSARHVTIQLNRHSKVLDLVCRLLHVDCISFIGQGGHLIRRLIWLRTGESIEVPTTSSDANSNQNIILQ